MSDPETVTLSDSAAHVYERDFVPNMFAQWPPRLAELAQIKAGDRVLDAGCGTGVFAREAVNHTGSADRVTGVDLNRSMLEVASSIQPQINWQQGDVSQLAFPDASFDVVASQFVLMFVPAAATALAEMWRVLAPGGRLVIAVWSDSPVYTTLTDVARNQGADEFASSILAPFCLGDPGDLLQLFEEAGIPDPVLHSRDGNVRFASVLAFVETEVKGWVMAEAMDDTALQQLQNAAESALSGYVDSSGIFVFPMNAHIVCATRK